MAAGEREGSRLQLGASDLRRWLRQPAAWAILGIGVLVALFAWRSLSVEVEQAARANFNAVVADSRHALETRLRAYQLVLLGMQGLFQAKPDLDRASFDRYIAELAPARNASQARSFSYAKHITHAEKQRYVDAVRNDRRLHPGGYPRFNVRPAGERAEYVVITYVAPFAPNERALGLDLVADPVRRLSVERARDSG